MHRKEANAREDASHTTLQETVSTTLLDAVDTTLQTLRVLHPTEPTPEPTTEPGTIKTRLWCSSLETFLDSTPFEKLSVVLRDGEFDFESTERVLCSAAARDLIGEPGGGEALKKWLANLARDEKFDVLAVALRWVSGGAGAGYGSQEMREDLSVETESREDDFFDENKQDADTQKYVLGLSPILPPCVPITRLTLFFYNPGAVLILNTGVRWGTRLVSRPWQSKPRARRLAAATRKQTPRRYSRCSTRWRLP